MSSNANINKNSLLPLWVNEDLAQRNIELELKLKECKSADSFGIFNKVKQILIAILPKKIVALIVRIKKWILS